MLSFSNNGCTSKLYPWRQGVDGGLFFGLDHHMMTELCSKIGQLWVPTLQQWDTCNTIAFQDER